MQKLRRALRQEFGNVLRLHRVGRLMTAPFPTDSLHFVRAAVLRCFGWRLGDGVLLASTPKLLGAGALSRRLAVGPGVYVNSGAIWDLGAPIGIGQNVHIGQDVSLLTTTHQVGESQQRAGALVSEPITIGAGAWLGAKVTVLGGVRVGAGAIVAAGCVVRSDVPPNCLFGGVPGRVIRSLDEHAGVATAEVVSLHGRSAPEVVTEHGHGLGLAGHPSLQ